VRGSIPVPGSSTVGYGGNTSCIEVRADGEIIVLDAGSGMRELGIALEDEFGPRPIKLTLLISHTHWDHIQGLPFFLPAYNEKNSLRLLGYEGARAGLATILASQMETSVFPVSLRDMPSAIEIEELREMEFKIGKVRVEARFVNHPGICVGYRLNTTNGSIAYLPDNEPYDVLKASLVTGDRSEREKAQAYAASARAQLVDFLKNSGIGSFVSIPTRESGLVRELITISFSTPQTFSASQRRLFEGLSDQIGIVLQSHRLLRDTQLSASQLGGQVRILQLVNQLSNAISTSAPAGTRSTIAATPSRCTVPADTNVTPAASASLTSCGRAEPTPRWPTWMMRSTWCISDARRMVLDSPKRSPATSSRQSMCASICSIV
jgi:hypothetical protein